MKVFGILLAGLLMASCGDLAKEEVEEEQTSSVCIVTSNSIECSDTTGDDLVDVLIEISEGDYFGECFETDSKSLCTVPDGFWAQTPHSSGDGGNHLENDALDIPVVTLTGETIQLPVILEGDIKLGS